MTEHLIKELELGRRKGNEEENWKPVEHDREESERWINIVARSRWMDVTWCDVSRVLHNKTKQLSEPTRSNPMIA